MIEKIERFTLLHKSFGHDRLFDTRLAKPQFSKIRPYQNKTVDRVLFTRLRHMTAFV